MAIKNPRPKFIIFLLGDRPMSDPGHGRPVDALDKVCKSYKNCLKCTRMIHGDLCISEFISYLLEFTNGEPVCGDQAGTCQRALCECDAKFAREHAGQTGVFDIKYHKFYSTTWDPVNDDAACPRGGGGVRDPQCCTPKDGTGPALLYNAAIKDCCSDGRVVNHGSLC